MTTPQTASPFSSNIKSNVISPSAVPSSQSQEGFLIRTMQDDLKKLQSNGVIEEKTRAPKNNNAPVEFKTLEPKPVDQSLAAPKKLPTMSQNFEPAKKMVEIPAATAPTVSTPPNPNYENKKSTAIRIAAAIIIILIICLAGLGIYYFLTTKKTHTMAAQPAPIETPAPAAAASTPEPAPISTPAPTDKYSTDKPNYLNLDLTTLSADDISSAIVKAANDIQVANSSVPYEFIVVDNNNNPVAFPIFALAAKLNLSPTLLSSLDTDFSLFLYKDGSNVRLAVSANIQNKDQLVKELPLQEKTFATDAAFLFLGNPVASQTGSFATSTYENYSIRYLNLDPTNDISIDYTLAGNKLVIGTSKNTERAVLDKLSAETASSETQDSAPAQTATAPPANAESAATPVAATNNIPAQTNSTAMQSATTPQ